MGQIENTHVHIPLFKHMQMIQKHSLTHTHKFRCTAGATPQEGRSKIDCVFSVFRERERVREAESYSSSPLWVTSASCPRVTVEKSAALGRSLPNTILSYSSSRHALRIWAQCTHSHTHCYSLYTMAISLSLSRLTQRHMHCNLCISFRHHNHWRDEVSMALVYLNPGL